VLLFVGLPAESQESTKPTAQVFATGLTNPRHIRFGPDRRLYVAEAGIGPAIGDKPLLATCKPVDSAFTVNHPYFAGYTGRVSRIMPNGVRQTVAAGLPSARDGFEDALGPTDMAWIGDTMYVLIEGGGCSRGLPDDPAGIIRLRPDGSYTYVADISAFIRANPVKFKPLCGPQGDCEPNGVPHSLLAIRRLLYVVDTNHNSILQIDPQTGAITRLYDLSKQDPAPITLIRSGKDFYLGGFDGLIQTFDREFGPVSTFDKGYGGIVDLASIRQRLYILETSSAETPFAPDDGSVIRRNKDGSRSVIVSGLNFPVGMAVSPGGGALFVSTNGYGMGAVEGLGEIVRIALH
jgi:DNA-binding beta-propeller fold protein YncE